MISGNRDRAKEKSQAKRRKIHRRSRGERDQSVESVKIIRVGVSLPTERHGLRGSK